MNKEILKIILDNAIDKVDGIDDTSKEKIVKSIVDDEMISTPVVDALGDINLNDIEAKKIEIDITKEISKSFHSNKEIVPKADWQKQVSIDLVRVLSSEPWWITKKG